jgi:hypothetical protein
MVVGVEVVAGMEVASGVAGRVGMPVMEAGVQETRLKAEVRRVNIERIFCIETPLMGQGVLELFK